eukprot:8884577-Prorocentrum_lima.AAC.1
MTSSLVGSEMCIRDSLCCSFAYHGGGYSPAAWGSEVVSTHAPTEEATSVSYTHLTLPTICSV